MSSITTLKEKINTKTSNFVLLSIATAGIYPILWMYKNYNHIDEVTKKTSANEIYIIWIAVCVGLGGAFTGTGEEVLDVISLILTLASSVLYVIWVFRVRASIQEYVLTEFKIDLPMNKFYTFIFNIYYINYCINNLEEVARKHSIINSQPETA